MSDIKNIISQSGIDSVTKLTNELEKAYLAIQDNIVAAKTLNDILARTQSMAKFTKSVDDNAMSQEKLRKAAAAAQLQEERLARFRQNEANKDEARQKRIEKNSVSEEDYYKRLSAQYDQMAKRAQNFGAQLAILEKEYGKNPTGKEAQRVANLAKSYEYTSKKAKELHDQLLKIDQNVGKSGRNVGNYPAFNGLNNSIQQITREFPAFANSVQTGIMALSNNIPIFFDYVKQTREEIKRLQSEGKPTKSLFNQISDAIFSWGTALSLGITLLTVYGKEVGEFVKAILQGKEALDVFTLSQKHIAEALKDSKFVQSAKDVIELKTNIDLAKDGFLSKTKVLNQYNETLGDSLGKVKSLDEAESALSKNSANYIKVTLLKAAAQLALEEAAKSAFDAEMARERGRMGITRDGMGGQQNLTFWERVKIAFEQDANYEQKILKDATDRTVSEAEKRTSTLEDVFSGLQMRAAKLAKESGIDFFGDKFETKTKKGKIDTSEFDFDKVSFEAISQSSKRITEDERNELTLRLEALDTYISAEQALIKNEQSKKIKLVNGNNKEIDAINRDAQAKYEDLLTETSKKELDIQEKAEKQIVVLFKDGLQEQEKIGKSSSAKKALQLAEQQKQNSKDADAQLKSLAEQYAKGEITQEEYGQRRIFAIKEINDQAADLEIKGLQEIIDIRKSFGIDTTSDEERLADIKKKYASDAADFEISQLEKVGEAEKALREKRKEFAREAFDFSIDLVNSSFERQSEAVNREMDLNEDRKNTEIENVNESILTQQQKEEQIKIIEAQSEQRKIALDQRQKEIEIRKAKFQKAAAIAEIAISTATAVAKISAQAAILFSNPFTAALGGLALAQIPYIIGIGALQAAAVLAQPIPKFAKGGTMSKDGLAEYGHGTELRIDPDGKTSLTSNTPEVGWVKKGTKFISAPETKQLLAKPDKHDFEGKSWDVSGLIAEHRNSTKELKKALGGLAIKNKRTQRNLDMQSWNGYLKRNGF